MPQGRIPRSSSQSRAFHADVFAADVTTDSGEVPLHYRDWVRPDTLDMLGGSRSIEDYVNIKHKQYVAGLSDEGRIAHFKRMYSVLYNHWRDQQQPGGSVHEL